MRTMRFYNFRIELLLLVSIHAAACSIGKTDIATGGDDSGEGGGTAAGTISITALKAIYINRPVTVTGEVNIRGRVISSDRWGNFYKTVYVEDDTGGIAVLMDLVDYFKTFSFGQEVTIYCNTLALGTYGGAVQMGLLAADGTGSVTYLPLDLVMSAFRLTGHIEEPSVTVVTIPELSPAHIHTFVEIRDVQFEEGANGATWCEDGISTEQVITDRRGNRLQVRTSGYAEFADELLPAGSGIIRGIAGYFNGSYQLTLINSHYAIMDSERFDVE